MGYKPVAVIFEASFLAELSDDYRIIQNNSEFSVDFIVTVCYNHDVTVCYGAPIIRTGGCQYTMNEKFRYRFVICFLLLVTLGFSGFSMPAKADSNYLDNCKAYPSSWTTTISTTLWALPSTTEARSLGAFSNEPFTIDMLYYNNLTSSYWYHGKTSSGINGFIITNLA